MIHPRLILNGLKLFYGNAENTEKIIMNCSLTSAAAATVGGFFPGIGVAAAALTCFGAIWTMYVLLCKELRIELSKHFLQFVARAILSNLAANLAVYFVMLIAAMFVPIGGSIACAIFTFVNVYLAGWLFLQLILNMAKKGIAINEATEDDARAIIDEFKPDKEDFNLGKKIFREHRKEYEEIKKKNESKK